VESALLMVGANVARWTAVKKELNRVENALLMGVENIVRLSIVESALEKATSAWHMQSSELMTILTLSVPAIKNANRMVLVAPLRRIHKLEQTTCKGHKLG